MKANSDPRISKYFSTAASGANAGQYVGGAFGLNPTAAQTLSLINPSISVADGLGYLTDYVEVKFLLGISTFKVSISLLWFIFIHELEAQSILINRPFNIIYLYTCKA